MSVTLATKARNAACDGIVDLIDEGSGAGTMMFTGAGGTPLLCELTFSDPAFGASVVGVATANAITGGVVANSANPSNIALCLFRDSDDEEHFRCQVGLSGSDINMSSISVNNGDTIDITALTFTVPAT